MRSPLSFFLLFFFSVMARSNRSLQGAIGALKWESMRSSDRYGKVEKGAASCRESVRERNQKSELQWAIVLYYVVSLGGTEES